MLAARLVEGGWGMHDPDEEANHMSTICSALREARVVGLARVSRAAT
jgi:hypothetical protein